MSRFCTLASSSKGNAAYLAGADTGILIDCGISFRRVRLALEEAGVEPASLRGVVVTHEHTDHIKGLMTLLKKLRIPLYGSEETLRCLCARDLIPRDATVIPLDGVCCIGDLEVTPFDTPHDAVHSIGLRVVMPDGRRVGIATDLGHVTDTVRRNLHGCDLVLLESNYDPGMLICSDYPYPLKQRIRSQVGHLSNGDCASEIARLVEQGTTRFVLGHLSEQNNLPVLAAQTTRAALTEMHMREQTDYILTVAPAHERLPMVVF